MSRKPQRSYVIRNPDGLLLRDTMTDRKRDAVDLARWGKNDYFVTQFMSASYPYSWKDMYRAGFRCEKVSITDTRRP